MFTYGDLEVGWKLRHFVFLRHGGSREVTIALHTVPMDILSIWISSHLLLISCDVILRIKSSLNPLQCISHICGIWFSFTLAVAATRSHTWRMPRDAIVDDRGPRATNHRSDPTGISLIPRTTGELCAI